MLQVKMLLQPHGQKMDMGIGDVFIALDAVDGAFGTYKYYINVPPSPFNPEEHVTGWIEEHDRNQNAFRLLQKILNDWGSSEDAESLAFAKRIQQQEEYG